MRSLLPCRWSRLLLGLALLALSGVFAPPAAAQTAALTGTVTDDLESDIRTGGSTIILTLTGDTFRNLNTARQQAIIDGLTSAQSEAAGWNALVKPAIPTVNVVRNSTTVVTITLPAVAAYDITATETITATIPDSVLNGGSPIVAAPAFDIQAISAALTGTVTDDSETDIRAGGSDLVLTLTGDTWVAAGGTFDAQRQNIIDGIDSAQAEATGWDAVVKAGLLPANVVRTSNTVVTVTLPAFAGYDITATEYITATVPATALAGGVALVASPTFDVTVDTTWYDGSWPYRKAVTLDGTSFCTTVSGFPVPVILTGDTDLRDYARSDGFDILFTADDGVTKVPHEIETFDDGTGDLTAWVKLDITAGVDKTLYMYYGNAGASDQQDSDNVWDANFQGVWHLDEAGTLYTDSSGYGNHGDDQVSATGQDGVISAGQQFDGTNDYVDMGNVLDYGLNDPMTYSAWIKTGVTWQQIAGKADSVTDHGVWFYMEDNALSMWICDPANCIAKVSTAAFNDNQWHHVVATYTGNNDASGIKLYADGSELSIGYTQNDAVGTVTNNFSFNIGSTNDGAYGDFTGYIDEVRMSDTERSTAWIQAEYCTAGGVVGGTGPPVYPAVTSVVGEIAPNAVNAASTGNSFIYDILPTVGGTDTGVDQVGISAPAGYANMSVTAVSLGGTGKSLNCPSPAPGQYCALITGQDITVTLGDQGGNGEVIQVVFSADAPGTAGSADFTATVDDTATAVAAQAVAVGNADGDGFDDNSQTVTVSYAATLTGTVTDDSETDIRAGGSTIILTLNSDTWVAAGATFNDQRQNIIDGIDSAQAEAAGWDAVVKAGLSPANVVRTSNTVVTIALPAFGAYDITADETITATIPATAVSGPSPLVANPSFDLTADTSWYPGGWLYRKTVTLDGSTFCKTVNDFPVPVILGSDADLRDYALSSGNDILFTEDDGLTKLPHEIETFDDGTGALVAWVKLDISAGVDQDLYMYYGNAGASDQQDTANLWDANFMGVWHLEEQVTDEDTSGIHTDSASTYDGSQQGNDDIAGKIAVAQQFDGIDDHILIGNPLNGSATGTISAWIYHDAITAARGRYVSLGNSMFIRHNGNGELQYGIKLNGTYNDIGVPGVLTADTWYYVTGTWDGTTQRVYLDGVEVISATPAGAIVEWGDGSISQQTTPINGRIDEARVSDIARSPDWIEAEVCTAGGVVGGTGLAAYPAATSIVGEISPNAVTAGSTGNAFTYDILPTVGAGDTGVNQVVISAPAGYANLNVTAVSLNGTGKSASGSCPNPVLGEYCASIGGQDITVTLGDQGGNGQVIQVVFDADAPGTTGSADFTATVDDTATAYSPQAVAVGNADGDGGDNDSQTVSVNATAALTGTVTDDTEADIRSGGSTLILTLAGDTWDATVGADNPITTALINGIDSAQSETTGWDDVVKAGLDYTDVERTNDTVVTIDLPPFATYDITATETITATIPATALAGGSPLVAAPTFDVTAVLKIVKRAFTAGGTAIASGATIPKGVPFKFVLYINNTDAARADVSLQDVLDAAFTYQTGSMKVSNGIAECAAADCDAGEEGTIFTTLNTSGTAVTDAIDDPDVASYAAGTKTIDVGDGTEAGNGQLDINANSVWGLIFEVTLN